MAVASVKSDSGFVDNWQSGKSLAECNLHMLTFEESCDVSFRISKDKKIVRAHRYVLISRSCVFHAMLCGPMAEKDEITITDVEADIFSELLRFLYTNESAPTPVNVTGLLCLAKKYAVGGLEHLCLTYLKSSLSAENACVILEQAHVFDEKQLCDKAMKVILDNGEKCLGTEDFRHLCRECFHKVISSDCLTVKPESIFSAAVSWAEEQCMRQGREITPANLRFVLGQTMYSIPFPDMDQERYVKEVLPRQILTKDENLTIMTNLLYSDSDPTPFKRRLRKTKAHSGHVSELSTPDSFDVILANSHVRFTLRDDRKLYGRIPFTCSHDVVLLGVYVYGSALPDDKYHLRVGQYIDGFSQSWFIKGEYASVSDEKFKEQCIKTLNLKKPLAFTRNTKYAIDVFLLDERQPVCHGSSVCKQVTVDQCTVENIHTFSFKAVNLIYGFILFKCGRSIIAPF